MGAWRCRHRLICCPRRCDSRNFLILWEWRRPAVSRSEMVKRARSRQREDGANFFMLRDIEADWCFLHGAQPTWAKCRLAGISSILCNFRGWKWIGVVRPSFWRRSARMIRSLVLVLAGLSMSGRQRDKRLPMAFTRSKTTPASCGVGSMALSSPIRNWLWEGLSGHVALLVTYDSTTIRGWIAPPKQPGQAKASARPSLRAVAWVGQIYFLMSVKMRAGSGPALLLFARDWIGQSGLVSADGLGLRKRKTGSPGVQEAAL